MKEYECFYIPGNELPGCFLKGLLQFLLGECGDISLPWSLTFLHLIIFFSVSLPHHKFNFSKDYTLARNADPVGVCIFSDIRECCCDFRCRYLLKLTCFISASAASDRNLHLMSISLPRKGHQP